MYITGLTSLILAKHLVQPFSTMYSEIVGRAQYQGMAFIATYICNSMAFLVGIASDQTNMNFEIWYHDVISIALIYFPAHW